jgi:hypothetical protein
MLGFLSYTLSPLRFVDGNQLTGPIPSEMGSLTRLQDLFLGKFATISSSKLETIRLLGSASQFIFHGLVDNNTLTGNLGPLFCNITDINITDAFLELILYADCAGSPPEVVCSCCVCFGSVRWFICKCQWAHGRLGFVKKQTKRIPAPLWQCYVVSVFKNSNVYLFHDIASNSHLLQSNQVYKYNVTLPPQAHTAPLFHLYGTSTVKLMDEGDSRRIHIYLKESIQNNPIRK